MFTVLWAKTLCVYIMLLCVCHFLWGLRRYLLAFLQSVNHYTQSRVCERRWRRNQAGGRLRCFHLPLSHTIHSFTHSLSSLSLAHAHKGNSTGVSRLRLVASTDTPNTMRQQHGSHLLKALRTHRLRKCCWYITKHAITSDLSLINILMFY